jgi:hypothetical protein
MAAHNATAWRFRFANRVERVWVPHVSILRHGLKDTEERVERSRTCAPFRVWGWGGENGTHVSEARHGAPSLYWSGRRVLWVAVYSDSISTVPRWLVA